MANKTLGLDARLYEYVLNVGLREPEGLSELRQATEKEELSVMRSAPEQGQFMAMLLRLMGARQVHTCYISEQWTFVARRFWEAARIENKVHLHLRPAVETLDALLEAGRESTFDFAFIDADKVNYQHYFDRCLQLIRPGGLIAVDNTLWGGAVVDGENQEESTQAIRTLNRKLKDDARIELAMLPLADGLTLARKRPVQ